ncbi:MAG: 3-hydroxyacyl-[acyl-carrier-protein] dehydratase FabZ [Candidatus Dadabacteria bacterium]|nr:MAG: 3-hydroxyacyl-[acyl-carrier-protein] dehydratase FabZ [Candidatus Dadabacteria bacterium]
MAEEKIAELSTEVCWGPEVISKLLPHRYPFLLVDKIINFVDGKMIVGVKNVTYNEAYFVGHFPHRPIMPGVLIMEAMAQTGGVFVKKCRDGVEEDADLFIVGADDFRWKRPVIPGDVLVIELELVKRRRPIWVMKGKAFVDGRVVASGTISASEQRKQN